MTAKILDGKRIAEDLLDTLKARVEARVRAGGSRPGLAVVLVGSDPASQSYVRNKRRAARESRHHARSTTTCPPAPPRTNCWP